MSPAFQIFGFGIYACVYLNYPWVVLVCRRERILTRNEPGSATSDSCFVLFGPHFMLFTREVRSRHCKRGLVREKPFLFPESNVFLSLRHLRTLDSGDGNGEKLVPSVLIFWREFIWSTLVSCVVFNCSICCFLEAEARERRRLKKVCRAPIGC